MEPQVNLHKNEKSDPALPTKLEQKKEDKFSRPAEKYYQRDSIRSDEALLKQAGWKGEPTKQGNKTLYMFSPIQVLDLGSRYPTW